MTDPIEPNRLRPPGEREAFARIEAIFERVDALSANDLATMAVPVRDPAARDEALHEAERLADARGLRDVLDDARASVRDRLLARATQVYPMYAVDGIALSSGRVEDRIEVIRAIEDAAAVAVVGDALEHELAWALGGPGMRMLGLGAPDDVAEPAPPAWSPTEEDWAAAARDAGDDAAPDAGDDDAPEMPGGRPMRVGLVAVATVVGVLAGLALGATEIGILFGLIIAGAVVAVGWTLASYRSRTRP